MISGQMKMKMLKYGWLYSNIHQEKLCNGIELYAAVNLRDLRLSQDLAELFYIAYYGSLPRSANRSQNSHQLTYEVFQNPHNDSKPVILR